MDIRQDSSHIPTIEEFSTAIHNRLFEKFLRDMAAGYACEPTMEFSKCSWEYGWNMKFKKSGKTLCTLYAREQYFTLMIVMGRKEQPLLENLLPQLCEELQRTIHETAEGNGQRWLMIDLEDDDSLYRDVWKLFGLRAGDDEVHAFS